MSAFDSNPANVELLVSVRSWAEYQSVVAVGGVDIIDFKEPSGGPLAATSTDLWDRVSDSLLDRNDASGHSLSAALGDCRSAASLAARVPDTFRFAKVGPERCSHIDDLSEHWVSIQSQLPRSVTLVPVAYADHANAQSPELETILEAAYRLGKRHFLIDTFDKAGPSSWETLGGNQCGQRWRKIIQRAAECGIWVSLAGRIDATTWDSIRCHPDALPQCIGVRGAVCEAARDSTLSAARLVGWVENLRTSSVQ